MSIARWFLLAGFAVFVLNAATTVLRAGLALRPADFAPGRGSPGRAVLYSLTSAMLPWKKESARLHPVVYALGVAYHAGIFLALLWLVLLFFGVGLTVPRPFGQGEDIPSGLSAGSTFLSGASALLLAASILCGLVLLLRRFAVANLRYFSSPDDYFANLAVTIFQALTATALLGWIGTASLFIYGGLLLAYVPFGKLRHAIYFPFARVYLGLFYGRRGVWPATGGKL